jgi:hypothetical protein
MSLSGSDIGRGKRVGADVGKTRYIWWGYVKAMIRRYPELKALHDEIMQQSVTSGGGEMRGGNSPGRPVEQTAMRTMGEPEQREYDAVLSAITETKMKPDGHERIKMIDLVFWRRSHTLQGAAIKCNVSGRTARRWHTEFIKATAQYYGLLQK